MTVQIQNYLFHIITHLLSPSREREKKNPKIRKPPSINFFFDSFFNTVSMDKKVNEEKKIILYIRFIVYGFDHLVRIIFSKVSAHR